MIDVSCLTEEEQETILAVLRRDAKLNEIEEQRITKLKKTEIDKRKLKYLTGEWFYETKSSRYRDKIHGTDIIRSSLTQRKPVTILELTQIWTERPTISKSEKKDVFVPPELSGLIPDLSSTSGDNRADHCQVVDNKVSYPQTKPRYNPFNTKPSGSESAEKTQKHLQTNGAPLERQHQAGASNWVPTEAVLSPVDASQTPQTPADDRHGNCPEPCSSQVSEPHSILLVQGKEEGHSLESTEAEESPIKKVLGWFWKRDGSKAKERSGVLEEQKKGNLQSCDFPEKENEPEAEIKEKPSPKPRLAFPTLFSRQKRTESLENKLPKGNQVCPSDDLHDHVIVESQILETLLTSELDEHNDEQNSSPNPNLHEQFADLFITEDGDLNHKINKIAGEESLDRGGGSQNRLTGMKSFWERRNNRPSILTLEKGLDGNRSERLDAIHNENKTLDQKMMEGHEEIDFGALEHNSKEDADRSLKETLSFTMDQTALQHEESPAIVNDRGQMSNPDEFPPTPIPLARKSLIQKNPEPTTHSGPSQQDFIKLPLHGSPTSTDPGTISSVAMVASSSKEKVDHMDTSILREAPKQLTVRPISNSKSLEDIPTFPMRDERWNNDPGIQITLSAEDAPNTLMPVLDPEKTKRLSCSVPDFNLQQDDGEESENLSVNLFHSDRLRKSSTNTNISASSGLASMSSGSVMNIYSSEFGHIGVRGTIQFAINYVPKLGEMQIFIVQCRDLAAAESKRNRSDPYVKCYLLPDKTKMTKRKTSVKKKTLNPIYNEILRYKIPMENLKVLTLNVSVWHHDTFGRNSFLGEVDVGLSDWDFNDTHMIDCELKERFSTPSSPTRGNPSMEMSGEMCVALRFFLQTSLTGKIHQTGEVQIWVKKCRNLTSSGGTLDPFVKCSLLPDTNQKRHQRTRVVKKTTNPEFNHTMVFDGLRPEDLSETCVELTVWDHDRLSNHFIGGTRLGLGTGKSHDSVVNWMDSNACEAELWKRMIELKNEWVEDTVPLRMLIMAKTAPR